MTKLTSNLTVAVDSGFHKEAGMTRVRASHDRRTFASKTETTGSVAAADGVSAGKRLRIAAGIDWIYNKVPCVHPTSGKPIAGKNWITQSKNDSVAWGPVSDGHAVTQFEHMDALADVAMGRGALLSHMFAANHGERTYMFFENPGEARTGPEGLVFKSTGVITDGKATKEALTARTGVFIPECENALSLSMNCDNLWSLPHNRGLEAHLGLLLKAIDEAGNYSQAVADYMIALDRIKVSEDEVASFAMANMGVDDALGTLLRYDGADVTSAKAQLITPRTISRRSNEVDQFMHDYHNAPGALPGKLSGVSQAITFRSTHRVAGTQKDQGRKLQSLHGGSAHKQQQRMSSALNALAVSKADRRVANMIQQIVGMN